MGRPCCGGGETLVGTVSFLSKAAFSWFILARRGGALYRPRTTNGSVGQKKHPYGESPFRWWGCLWWSVSFYKTALTGRPPYGNASYGQTALREGPLRGGFLREGPLRTTGKLTGSYGEGLPELGGNFRLCAVDQKKVVFSYGWAVSGPSAL